MMKNFAYKKDGSHWSIWDTSNCHTIGDTFKIIDFYPFPTIKLNYNEDTFETDEHEFNIEFAWLFWEIRITKYWGKAFLPIT